MIPWLWTLPFVLIFALLWLRQIRLRSKFSTQPKARHKWSSEQCEIYYQRKGHGPTMICLHGLGASSFSFEKLQPHLSQHFDLVLMDLPGFGQSRWLKEAPSRLEGWAKVIHEFINDVAPGPVLLCGSSFGGTLALELAKLSPQKYSHLIVMAPATNAKEVPFFVSGLRYLSSALKVFVQPEVVALLLWWVRTGPRPQQHDVGRYLQPYLLNSQALYYLFYSAKLLRDPSRPRHYSDLATPILILYGERDKQVSLRSVTELKNLLPRARLEFIKKSGHHPHESFAEIVSQKIVDFHSRNTDS